MSLLSPEPSVVPETEMSDNSCWFLPPLLTIRKGSVWKQIVQRCYNYRYNLGLALGGLQGCSNGAIFFVEDAI